MKKFLLLLLLFVIPLISRGQCLMEKAYHLPNIPLTLSHITEKQFHDIIDRVSELYQQDFQLRRLNLQTTKNWRSNQVNAFARARGRNRRVIFHGGFARYPSMTIDAFAFIVCHEIGHHIGGRPLASPHISVEGQADYFASSQCMKRYIKSTSSYRPSISAATQKFCQKVPSELLDQYQCERITEAGVTISNVFARLQNQTQTISLDLLPLKDQTRRTLNSVPPTPQCRLETVVAGMLCQQSQRSDFSNKDIHQGACLTTPLEETSGYQMGRPRCWFAPGLNYYNEKS